jgi:hypothetical protein
MFHPVGVVFVTEAGSQSAADPHAGVYLLREQGASIAGEEASVEIGDKLADTVVLKKHTGILTLWLKGVAGCFLCSFFRTKLLQKTNSRHLLFVIFSGWPYFANWSC